MTREDYIRSLITEHGYNVKSFANSINLPYSTLRSILSGGVGGASVDNVIKICKGLGITVDILNKCGDIKNISLSEKERALIVAYRSQPSIQVAVNRLLGIDEGADTEKSEKRA